MSTNVWDEPVWEELGSRAQDLRTIENFLKKSDKAPRHVVLRALVEKSRLCASLGREEEVLSGYDQVLAMANPPADSQEALQAARARINRGSFFRRKGMDSDAALEWDKALKDYGHFSGGPVNQVLIKAAVYGELVRHTPREKVLKNLLARWGKNEDRLVHSELVHHILDRILPWIEPPEGVSWLYYALTGNPRPRNLLKLGAQAYGLLDVDTRKKFWDLTGNLEDLEVQELLGGIPSQGLYDWEISRLETHGQSCPKTSWGLEESLSIFSAPEEGIRNLCIRNRNSAVWSDGKGRIWEYDGKSSRELNGPLWKIRRLIKGPESSVLGQFWERPHDVLILSPKSEPRLASLDKSWVWARENSKGDFLIGTEDGQVIEMKTDGTWSVGPWSVVHSFDGWLSTGGELFRLVKDGSMHWEETGKSKTLNLTGEVLTAWAGDPIAKAFLVGTEKGSVIRGTWTGSSWKAESLLQEPDKVLALAIAPQAWAAGFQKKLFLSRKDFPKVLGIPVDGLKSMAMDGTTGELLWSDSRCRLWRLGPGEKLPKVWWGFQDWPVALAIEDGEVFSGGLDGLGVNWSSESLIPRLALGRQAWERLYWAGNVLVLQGRGFLQFINKKGEILGQRFHGLPITAVGHWEDLVASGDEKGQVQIGAAGDHRTFTLDLEAPVRSLLMISGARGAAGLETGAVVFFVKKGSTWGLDTVWNIGGHGIKDLRMKGSSIFALGNSTALGIWDLEKSAPGAPWLGGHHKPLKICVPGTDYVFTAGEDNKVLAWDCDGSGFDILSEEKIPLEDLVPGYRCVIGRAKEKELWLWDLPSTGQGRKLYGSKGFVTAAAGSADGFLSASGARDRSLRIWKLPEGRTVKKIEGLEEILTDLVFSPDGKHLAGTGELGKVWVWELSSVSLDGEGR